MVIPGPQRVTLTTTVQAPVDPAAPPAAGADAKAELKAALDEANAAIQAGQAALAAGDFAAYGEAAEEDRCGPPEGIGRGSQGHRDSSRGGTVTYGYPVRKRHARPYGEQLT